MAKNDNKTQEEPLGNQLWKAADKLRKTPIILIFWY
jgi:hypothetical protein